jgi:hypothetical protein
MIPVDLGDGVIQQMDASLLEGPLYQITQNEHEHTIATEYRFEGRVVHRSVHIILKEGMPIDAILGRLN